MKKIIKELKAMDQNQRSAAATTAASRGYQFHPARAAIIDLFNLYLGVIYFSRAPSTFFFFSEFLVSCMQFNSIESFYLYMYIFFSIFYFIRREVANLA